MVCACVITNMTFYLLLQDMLVCVWCQIISINFSLLILVKYVLCILCYTVFFSFLLSVDFLGATHIVLHSLYALISLITHFYVTLWRKTRFRLNYGLKACYLFNVSLRLSSWQWKTSQWIEMAFPLWHNDSLSHHLHTYTVTISVCRADTCIHSHIHTLSNTNTQYRPLFFSSCSLSHTVSQTHTFTKSVHLNTELLCIVLYAVFLRGRRWVGRL